ncbi:DUF6415 family natural product biosynthesis protein [Wenjunlia tyrosinilytica]|uniref:Uncharacterized protein n=1 Tax=Wenjunlia tyrosinilytica TaxID=1544741 RepID=A0A917ZWK1_9ACTN|nr:DUF6415 family natural product biosynthesis protein [Wenjunlia tyrosinilytica]GGO99217.1 hypothetical protein GCM10012280_65160 [Wenjunlia tyrosinilytica]
MHTLLITMPTSPRRRQLVKPWAPPMDADALERVLTKIRDWEPFDGETLLDDLGAVLGDQAPREDEVGELAERLRGSLVRLVRIAVGGLTIERDERMNVLVARARELRSEELPGDYRKAVGHLRRLGWVTNELLEGLTANGFLRCAHDDE